MISDSVDQQLYNDTKLDQFGQVLKSAMLVYLSVELPHYNYCLCGKTVSYILTLLGSASLSLMAVKIIFLNSMSVTMQLMCN